MSFGAIFFILVSREDAPWQRYCLLVASEEVIGSANDWKRRHKEGFRCETFMSTDVFDQRPDRT